MAASGPVPYNLQEILKKYWGFDAFRPLQEDIINAVLNNQDLLAIMPTGGGKSLCYQVPAMAREGVCLVISPLIALMKDQVESLRKKNITAFAIYSGMSRKEVINILKTSTDSNCKFLYVSPERLETFLFKEYLPAINVNLIAVDEAHCISQWGYDFRPPYLKIAEIRTELPGIPVLGLTASATREVQGDICEKLLFKEKKIFRQSFNRPNLSYSVFQVDSKINKLVEIIKNVAGSGIVYCKSRRRTREISDLLHSQQISSDFYHAGLNGEERARKQEDWVRNNTRIIVCTNAFGMGIDKPDVRSVVHIDVPDCLENYYQEAGRAGRDGQKSYAVLLHDSGDLQELKELPDIRFPSPASIKTVYQHLFHYLQVPAGSGEGNSFDFELGDFVRKFKINNHLATYSLKALEQEGMLSLNEQVFLPATVQFTGNRQRLAEFELSDPLLDPLIKALLRGYGGILDSPVFIAESMLGSLLKQNREQVKLDLGQLHERGIIIYKPQKELPQIVLLKNRVAVTDFSVNHHRYAAQKEKFVQRVKTIVGYVVEKQSCRSQLIGNYFGDPEIVACGICDNCIRQRREKMKPGEFQKIQDRILELLGNKPHEARELLDKLSAFPQENAWKVIELLQAENKILVDAEGMISPKP